MPKYRDIIFDHKAVYDQIKNHFNVVHFNNKFVKAMVVKSLPKKVRNRVNKPADNNILHGFVENRAILKKLLFLSVGFLVKIPQERITYV